MADQLSREELSNWAEALDAETAPYSSQVHAENHFFVSQLEKRAGDEFGEIRDTAQQDSSRSEHESKKWKHLSWGSVAAGIGGGGEYLS